MNVKELELYNKYNKTNFTEEDLMNSHKYDKEIKSATLIFCTKRNDIDRKYRGEITYLNWQFERYITHMKDMILSFLFLGITFTIISTTILIIDRRLTEHMQLPEVIYSMLLIGLFLLLVSGLKYKILREYKKAKRGES